MLLCPSLIHIVPILIKSGDEKYHACNSGSFLNVMFGSAVKKMGLKVKYVIDDFSKKSILSTVLMVEKEGLFHLLENTRRKVMFTFDANVGRCNSIPSMYVSTTM